MSAVDVVLQVFRSVEERNPRLAAEVYHDDLEFHWPRPLPYAGSSYGLKASLERRPGWAETWNPFQSEAERGLGARVVASSEDEVVVLWHQRGRDRAGRWLATPVLGLYQVRDGKLARA
jgi:ketosteroid isomerase-like protein